MIGRMLITRAILAQVFGTRVVPLLAGSLLLVLRNMMTALMYLDGLFSARLRATTIRRPVVIVGNPRTGTTFLQRFLCDNKFGAGLQLYRMVYPSLIAQKLLTPIIPFLEVISPSRFHKGSNHESGLQAVETDDVAAVFRNFDGYFLYCFAFALSNEDYRPVFDVRLRDTSVRDYDWLEQLWRRSLVFTGEDRVVAKMFSAGMQMQALLDRFPDARVLYMARDPLALIPSAMSLVTSVLDNAFGFWSLPEDTRQRYLERLYLAFVSLLQNFRDDWVNGRIDQSRVYVVRYDRMMNDFEGVMAEICGFIGHDPSAEQLRQIVATAAGQRSYAGGGTYDLKRYGLDADRICLDLAAFTGTFLPTPTMVSARADPCTD